MRPHQLLLIIIATLAGITRAYAQDDSARSGLWLNGGVGWGVAWASIERLGTASENSIALTLRAGVTLSRHVLVGGEFNTMPIPEDQDCGIGPCFGIRFRGVVSVLGVVLWYPYEKRGLYFKGGAGVVEGYLGLGAYTWDESGWTGQLGVGYDLAPSESISLSPFVAFQIWPAGGGGTVNLITGGIGLTVQ